MKKSAAILTILGLYWLHQDWWFWGLARPLVFGVLPIGLFYHAMFTLATSLAMAVLVKLLWPAGLDAEGPSGE